MSSDPTTSPLLGSFHRRTLPPPAIAFSSAEGKAIFSKALNENGLEMYFPISEAFQSQGHPAFCGLGSLTVALNSILLDPQRVWQGVWRWFDESMLSCCDPLDKIKLKGISLSKLNCLAACQGADTELKFASDVSEEVFREDVKRVYCKSSVTTVLIVSYSRATLKQTGSGHFSPIGGYCSELDMVLIMDVARFKYPPHWVPLSVLYEAMCSVDDETGVSRGYMMVSLPKVSKDRLFELCSCHGEDLLAEDDGNDTEVGKKSDAVDPAAHPPLPASPHNHHQIMHEVHTIVTDIYEPTHKCNACTKSVKRLHSEL